MGVTLPFQPIAFYQGVYKISKMKIQKFFRSYAEDFWKIQRFLKCQNYLFQAKPDEKKQDQSVQLIEFFCRVSLKMLFSIIQRRGEMKILKEGRFLNDIDGKNPYKSLRQKSFATLFYSAKVLKLFWVCPSAIGLAIKELISSAKVALLKLWKTQFFSDM